MADNSEFSGRLLLARSQAGISQRALSKKSGISVPQITRYESGKSKPRLGGVLKLAKALEIEARDLMPGIELMPGFKEATNEISVSLPDDEYRQLVAEANRRDIPIEELTGMLAMVGGMPG